MAKFYRRFLLAGVVLTTVALSGCAAWNSPGTSEEGRRPFSLRNLGQDTNEFFKARFGESAGVDPRAREIEKRLGY